MNSPGPQDEQAFLRMILAGAASVCAGSFTHPVDTVKIRLQKEGEGAASAKYKNIFRATGIIYREEGFRALYKGLSASIFRESTYSTLRLGLYEPFKNMLWKEKDTPLYVKFVAGLLSGSTGAIVANPCDVIKIRLQSIKGKNMGAVAEINKILGTEGIKGLYKGMAPNLLRGAILTGTKMATYDQTKQLLIKYFKFEEGFGLYFVCSFATGIVYQYLGLMLSITTAPMDLIKTRIMSQESGHRIYTGLSDCAIKTFRQEGLGAFYKGFLPQWIRFGPFNIIQLIVWEELRTVCGIKNI